MTAGDEKQNWYEQVVYQYQAQLVRYSIGYVQDLERARDIVQDAFLKLWQADWQEVKNHVLPWLYTVCRNRAIDIQRKESKMHSMSEGLQARLPDPAPNPAQIYQKQDEQSLLPYLIQQLSPDQQEVVRLKFTEERSYKEIAEITDRSINAVGLLLHKAIKKLQSSYARQQVAEQGETI